MNDKLKKMAEKRSESRRGARVPCLFMHHINEDRMAECIADVKKHIMGDKEKVVIHGMQCTFYDFCVLTMLALGQMKFLENKARSQFCIFLQKKVFKGNAPQVRTFNNHANKDPYKGLAERLALCEADPSVKLVSQDDEGCYMAFQKIKRTFQRMEYFKELKGLREELAKLTL